MKLGTGVIYWLKGGMRVEREEEKNRDGKIDEGMWGLQPRFCTCQRKLMHMLMHVCLPD